MNYFFVPLLALLINNGIIFKSVRTESEYYIRPVFRKVVGGDGD